MGINVNLDSELVNMACSYACAKNCSVPKQIEHWARIGRIAEENPDLSYNIVKEMLLGMEDMRLNNVQEYDPDALTRS